MAAAVALGTLMLAGCSAPPEPEPEVLAASEAGGAYLDAVCPVNAAWDIADAELEQLRLALARGDDDAEPVADALSEVAQASKKAAARLDPKQTTWPSPARSAIADVRQTLLDDREQAETVAKLPANKIAAYTWVGGEETAAAAAAAHAALELPDGAEDACSQWADQRAPQGTGSSAEGQDTAPAKPGEKE